MPVAASARSEAAAAASSARAGGGEQPRDTFGIEVCNLGGDKVFEQPKTDVLTADPAIVTVGDLRNHEPFLRAFTAKTGGARANQTDAYSPSVIGLALADGGGADGELLDDAQLAPDDDGIVHLHSFLKSRPVKLSDDLRWISNDGALDVDLNELCYNYLSEKTKTCLEWLSGEECPKFERGNERSWFEYREQQHELWISLLADAVLHKRPSDEFRAHMAVELIALFSVHNRSRPLM